MVSFQIRQHIRPNRVLGSIWINAPLFFMVALNKTQLADKGHLGDP